MLSESILCSEAVIFCAARVCAWPMGSWGRMREMAGDISTGLGGSLVEVGEREISSRSSAMDFSSSGRVSTPRGWLL